MNALRSLVLAGGVTLALVGCGSSSSTKSTSATATTAAAGGATTIAGSSAPAGANAVNIGDFKYGPADLKVAVGSSVTFTNKHTQAHTATSSGNFDTQSIAPGASATVKLDKAGTFTYTCSFHPFMKGTITVA